MNELRAIEVDGDSFRAFKSIPPAFHSMNKITQPAHVIFKNIGVQLNLNNVE
jgi:hypothetical protein